MSDINPTSRESENALCMNPQEDDQVDFTANPPVNMGSNENFYRGDSQQISEHNVYGFQ